MTIVEEKAIDAWAIYEYREHPKGLYHTCFVDGYKEGYEQAEKDLALTADDIETMCRIRTALLIENYHLFDGTDNRKLYEEVLIKFNESKRK